MVLCYDIKEAKSFSATVQKYKWIALEKEASHTFESQFWSWNVQAGHYSTALLISEWNIDLLHYNNWRVDFN